MPTVISSGQEYEIELNFYADFVVSEFRCKLIKMTRLRTTCRQTDVDMDNPNQDQTENQSEDDSLNVKEFTDILTNLYTLSDQLLSNCPSTELKTKIAMKILRIGRSEFGPALLTTKSLVLDLHTLLHKCFQRFCETAEDAGAVDNPYRVFAAASLLNEWKQVKSLVNAVEKWGLTKSGLLPIYRLFGENVVEFKVKSTLSTDSPCLQLTLDWLQETFRDFTKTVLLSSTVSMPALISNLSIHLRTIFIETRLSRIFDLIVRYPETAPVITDLVSSLRVVGFPAAVDVVALTVKAFRTQLLHAGTHTGEILKALISGVQVLTLIDPTGAIRDLCLEPIKEYLKGREDAARAIVTCMAEDNDMQLLGGIGSQQDVPTDEITADSWMIWQPEPIEALNLKVTMDDRCNDIVTMLVGAYGTNEVFISEYCSLLSKRILRGIGKLHNLMDREKKYLDVMRKKFSEADLQCCDVMMKDVDRSIKFIKQCKLFVSGGVSVSLLLLTASCWPKLASSKLILPAKILSIQENIISGYKTLTSEHSTFDWMPMYGLVTVEMTINGNKVTQTITTSEAAVIEKFIEKGTWTLNELSNSLGANSALLRLVLGFWTSYKLIREDENETYVLTENRYTGEVIERFDYDFMSDALTRPEEECQRPTEAAKQETSLPVCWMYICSLLRSVNAMSGERIVHSLGNHAASLMKDLDVYDIQKYLSKKVESGELQLTTDGHYQLARK